MLTILPSTTNWSSSEKERVNLIQNSFMSSTIGWPHTTPNMGWPLKTFYGRKEFRMLSLLPLLIISTRVEVTESDKTL
jgi:hypothetical protein